MQKGNGLTLTDMVQIDQSGGPLTVTRQPTATAFLTQIGVNQTASGDLTIIPAVAGKVIRVYRVFLMSSVAGMLTPKDGATAFCGPLPFAANGGLIMDFDGEPWFTCTSGNAFVINMSAAGQLSGRVGYTVN